MADEPLWDDSVYTPHARLNVELKAMIIDLRARLAEAEARAEDWKRAEGKADRERFLAVKRATKAEAERDAALEALKPFAKAVKEFPADVFFDKDGVFLEWTGGRADPMNPLSFGDFRRAAALTETGGGE